MVAIIIITLVCAVISEIATASRQIWSFARDKGLPFSSFLSKVRIPHLHLLTRRKPKPSLVAILTHLPPPPGLPLLPHPPKRRHRLLPLRHNNLPHQPRLLRRPQRHRLPHPLRPPRLLHPLHRLHPLQAPAPGTPTPSALVPRPSRHRYKHHRSGFLGPVFYLLLFPDRDAGAAGHDELEHRHVWGDVFVGDGVLCREGEEGVYPTCKDCQEGCLSKVGGGSGWMC